MSARSDFRSLGNIFGRAEVQDALAKLALEGGNCLDANEHVTNSLRLRTRLPSRTGLQDPLGIAKVHLLLGRVYRYEGDQQRALEQYEAATNSLKTTEQTTVKGDPVAHYQGDSELARGYLDKARRCFESCLQSSKSRKDTRGEIHAMYALAKVTWQEALAAKDAAQRSEGLDKALQACVAALEKPVREKRAAKIQLLMARIYSSMDSAPQAQHHYDIAVRSFRRMRMVFDETEALQECGELISKQDPKRLPEATSYFVKALDACIGDRQRARVRETVERCISHVPVTDMCRLLASLEERTVDLEQQAASTVEFYSATLGVADSRDFVFWATLAHAGDLAEVKHLIRTVWAPMLAALQLGRPISIRKTPLMKVLQAASKGMDGTAVKLNLPRTLKVSVMADERHLSRALCQLAEILSQLSDPPEAGAVSVKVGPKRHGGDVGIVLAARGRAVNELALTGLLRRGGSIRPEDVGLRSEDWPRYVVSDACITAMSGTLVFHSIEQKSDKNACNEFQIVLPSA